MTTYKISKAAEKAGFSASALRFYESSGLVPEAVRTPAGYRTYDDAAIERLRFVHRARGLGLPLEEIGGLVQIWDAGRCAPVQHDLAAHIADRRARVQDRVAELQALAAQLEDARRAVLAAPGDGGCGPECACLAGPDVAPAGPEDEGLRRAGPVGLPLLAHRPEDRTPSAGVLPEPSAGVLPEPSAGVLPDPSAGLLLEETVLACTLEAGQMRDRLSAWQDLVAEALTRQPMAGGQRLVFAASNGLAARIAELCELEQGCCSFLTFALQLSPARITLDVTAPDGAGQLVSALLDGQL